MIRLFEDFNKQKEIQFICEHYGIENYTINENLTVDINGDFIFNHIVTKLPIKLNKVSGNIYINNCGLTTLEGLPEYINDIELTGNRLTNLIGFPKHCNGNIDLSNNQLTSLEGIPKGINGNLTLYKNKLTNTDYFPDVVEGYIDIIANPITHFTKQCDCWSIFSIFSNYKRFYKDEIMFELSDQDLCILLRYCEDYNIFDKEGNVNRNRLERLFKDNKF